jgi:formylmethanofuran dehydrogenase subunit E
MPILNSNDPADAYDIYCNKQQEEIDKLPKCEHCGEPIMIDHYYLINYDIICQSCLESDFMKWTDDYI